LHLLLEELAAPLHLLLDDEEATVSPAALSALPVMISQAFANAWVSICPLMVLTLKLPPCHSPASLSEQASAA
jgi:hypothetical protein